MEHTKGKLEVICNDLIVKTGNGHEQFRIAKLIEHIDEMKEVDEASAQRIVKCCNEHDGLVDALKEILNAGMNGYARWTGTNSAERELISAIKNWQGRIKSALAKL